MEVGSGKRVVVESAMKVDSSTVVIVLSNNVLEDVMILVLSTKIVDVRVKTSTAEVGSGITSVTVLVGVRNKSVVLTAVV